MTTNNTVAVYGAYGHTGRFVVAELLERGFVPVLAGRDEEKLRALAEERPGLDVAVASVDDPASLDRALAGAAAVVNSAGPFATTAAPLIEAALRAGIAYVDVAAEIEANADTFAHFADRARAAGAVVVPAMAFFGGLGDLLATAAMGDWATADEAHIAYGLSSWHPTEGTRAAGEGLGERRDGRMGPLREGATGVPRRRAAHPGVGLPRADGSQDRPRRVHDGRRRHRAQPLGHPRGDHLHDDRGGRRSGGPGHPGSRPLSTGAAAPRRPSSSTSSCARVRRNDVRWHGVRTSTPSRRRWRWKRSPASSRGA